MNNWNNQGLPLIMSCQSSKQALNRVCLLTKQIKRKDKSIGTRRNSILLVQLGQTLKIVISLSLKNSTNY